MLTDLLIHQDLWKYPVAILDRKLLKHYTRQCFTSAAVRNVNGRTKKHASEWRFGLFLLLRSYIYIGEGLLPVRVLLI